ncbi:S1C family serine protease [Planctomycetes bacterium K23_9]|uniref:Serine protease HhoB n=1 Tax=Stieleria marina TaxID=1930275 RepID=A0A517NY70_9BACT|nr:Putative serine protease HhoB precursor [Planctomycetes bacterium K23_9]
MLRVVFAAGALLSFGVLSTQAQLGDTAVETAEVAVQEDVSANQNPDGELDAKEDTADDSEVGSVRSAVVKIYSIRRSHSLSSPWKRLTSSTVTGSGFVLSPTEVLTNYHVVAMTTDVSVSLNGQSERLSGRVKAIAPGLDIALIELEEPLPDRIKPLPVAKKTPKGGTQIQVYGYPKGGDALSITEGVISRMEHVRYKYNARGLRTQIDAPLNSGNSGGPMIADGKVLGIAFSGLSSSNDIGYAIPCEELNVILDDMQDGTYDGKPQLWISTSTLASKEMRKWLKMPSGATGIRFARMPIPVDDYPLQSNDVITHVGEFEVNNLGKVNLDSNTQVTYTYAVDQAASNGKVPLKILRDGKPMEIEVPVFRDSHLLLDYMIEQQPTYFVYGPIVFGVATVELLSSFDLAIKRGGRTGAGIAALVASMQERENPLFMRRYECVKDDAEELVIVTKLIRNRMTRDTSLGLPAVVRSINGQPIKTIKQAAEVLAALEDELLVIEFDDNRSSTIVLDRKAIEKAHDQIMEDNGIVKAASKNLRDVWDR